MAANAHKGITNKYGLMTPTGGYAQETRRKTVQQYVETPDENGVTVAVDPIPYKTQNITMRGIGLADFTLIVPGITAVGTLAILSVKRTEGNAAKKTFEYTARKRTNN